MPARDYCVQVEDFAAAPGRVGSTLLALPGEGVRHLLRPPFPSEASSCRPARTYSG